MFKKLLKNTKFRLVVKNFYKTNMNVVDILLFGSLVRGKFEPKDVDILIIYNKKLSKEIIYDFKNDLNKIIKGVNIVSIDYKELFDKNFQARGSFLTESYSLITNKFISQGMGFSNMVLFKYDLGGLTKSKKMGFYHSLNGRNNKGILKELKAHKFSDNVIIVSIEKEEELKEFFDFNHVKFIEFPILIPEIVLNSKIFN